MDDARRSGLTRRDALALGALTGAAGLVRGGVGPATALAAPRSFGVTVPADAFLRDGTTAPVRAPGRFVLLGVRDPSALGAALQVRARRAGGAWTAWAPLHAHVAHGPDRPGRGAGATDPLWTGSADELQLRASRRPRAAVAPAECVSGVTSHYRAQDVGGEARSASSTLQSVLRGHQTTEVDYLNGEIELIGRLHGVPTPYNSVVREVATRMAATKAQPGSVSLEELRAMVTRKVS